MTTIQTEQYQLYANPEDLAAADLAYDRAAALARVFAPSTEGSVRAMSTSEQKDLYRLFDSAEHPNDAALAPISQDPNIDPEKVVRDTVIRNIGHLAATERAGLLQAYSVMAGDDMGARHLTERADGLTRRFNYYQTRQVLGEVASRIIVPEQSEVE